MLTRVYLVFALVGGAPMAAQVYNIRGCMNTDPSKSYFVAAEKYGSGRETKATVDNKGCYSLKVHEKGAYSITLYEAFKKVKSYAEAGYAAMVEVGTWRSQGGGVQSFNLPSPVRSPKKQLAQPNDTFFLLGGASWL